MMENPNVFRNADITAVEKALLDKLAAIEKKHPKYFKEKGGALKDHVILTYPVKDNDYQFGFALKPGTDLPLAVQKKCLQAFNELQADLAAREPNHAHPPAGAMDNTEA